MRILNLQNAILVSLTVAGIATGSACSSSDVTHPDATAGANASAGSGNSAGSLIAAGGSGNTGNTGNTTSGGSGNSAGTTANAGAATGGGSAGSAPTGPSVCDGTGSRVLDPTVVGDDFVGNFETADASDATKVPPSWYGFNDVQPTGNAIQAVRTAGGAIATGFGARYFGTGAKTPVAGGYGVGLEVNVGVAKDLPTPQYCVDASAFKGVSFWAKAGSATTATISAGFVVPSQNQVKNGGDCLDSLPAAKCNNYPQKNFTLTTEWAQYTVDFEGLKGSTGATVVAGKVQQILWLAPTKDWDFSIDEVAFYATTPAPATPVVPPAAAP